MSAKPKDHRPKVISFRSTIDGLDIAAKQSVLWPCHAFSISIPQKKKSGLNVFEETVLKITEVESNNTDKISQLTCMEKELVAFIQNRLMQLHLLNDRYDLSEQGTDLLQEWKNKSEESLEYTVATIFVDLFSGKLLPYVNTEQLRTKKILKITDSGFVEFLDNHNNENSKIIARQIRPTKNSFWKVVPNSNEIIRAIRDFKKRHRRFSLLNKNLDQYPPPVPMAEAISLHDKPELVYLHCEAIVQIGNSDILVTDGCGFGFSESFANYLTSQDLFWVTNLKQKGIVERIDTDDIVDELDSHKHYKYPEISRRMKNSQSSLDKIKMLKPSSSNYEREYRREIESLIKNLYSGLEWASRQVVSDFPVPEWENIFSSQNFRDNEKLLYGFAKKAGFLVTEQNRNILQVKAGAIRQIEQGNAELQPLLALCIAGSNSNSGHPIHNLALNHSGFLGFALKLKRHRDPIEHGSTENLILDRDILDRLFEDTASIVTSLVPGVAEDLEVEDIVISNLNINQDRLKATVELEKRLGSGFLFNLSLDIKEQLLRSEMMLAKNTDAYAIEMIKSYASVIQQILSVATQDRKYKDECDDIREQAIDKIVHAGFYSSSDLVPVNIANVNVGRLRRAVDGSSASLGAELLAVFLLGSENELSQLRSLDPSFVDLVANLDHLRGHGNDSSHLKSFSRREMISLHNNVFKAIKVLMEIF